MRRGGRRDERVGVTCVHPLFRFDCAAVARDQRGDDAVVACVAHRKVVDPAGRKKLMPHHLVEVACELRAGRQLVKALVQSGLVLGAGAELPGIDTVERGRLVQADEGVGVVPVAAGAIGRSTMAIVAPVSLTSESANAMPAAPAPMTS